MRQFDSPVSQFRYDLQKAGDKPLSFSVDGHYYPLTSIYGETDLLTCQNNCILQSGFYSLVFFMYLLFQTSILSLLMILILRSLFVFSFLICLSCSLAYIPFSFPTMLSLLANELYLP